MRRLGQGLLLVGLAAVGVVVGIVGAFVHDLSVGLAGVALPAGLPLALVPAASVYLLAGWLLQSRLAVLAPGAGWLVPALVMSAPRPEGDLVVSANAAGYLFLLGGAVLIGLGIAFSYGGGGRRLRPVP